MTVLLAVAAAGLVAAPTAFAQRPPDPPGAAGGGTTSVLVARSTGLPIWALVVIAVGSAAVAVILTLVVEHTWRARRAAVKIATA